MEQSLPSSVFYDALLKSSRVVFWVLNQEKTITYSSEATTAMLGYGAAELAGQPFSCFLHPDDSDRISALPAFTGTSIKSAPTYCRIRHKTGHWVLMEVNITDARHQPAISGYIITLTDATLLKEAQQKSDADLCYYNALFKSHPGMVFTLSPAGNFEKVNKRVKELMGYSEKEMLGKHYTAFTSPTFQVETLKALSKFANHSPYFFEGDVTTKSGKSKTLLFIIIPVIKNGKKIGLLSIARDITAEKVARKELEKLSMVASRAVSCVLITDASGKTEWVNEQFTRVTGYSLEEAVGITPGQLLQGPETDPATVQYMHDKVLAREPFYVEVINYRKNGEAFWFNMDIIPLFDKTGKLTQFFAIQNDIDERKKTQERMRQLTEDLIRHNKELQQFIYIVSHNLRAPVANIMGLTSILENYADNPEIFSKTIQHLKQTSESLDTVIKDLNEILSFRNGHEDVNREKVSIKSICLEVINSLRAKIESVAAKIDINVPGKVCIQANRAYVYSIFHNLISNAIKYRHSIRPLQITITSSSTDGMHEIRVADNGMGIDLPKVGNQLFRLYGKIDKETEGRGIGLYMVKTQVESLNGTIEVDSIPGAGTTFILRFHKMKIIKPSDPFPSI